MLQSLKYLKKWKLYLFLIFALLYSCQGVIMPIIIQLAGKLDLNNTYQIVIFGIVSISLWILVYLFMYVENVLLRSLVKDNNTEISKQILDNYASKQICLTDSELTSLLTQDLTIFWQDYLLSLLIFPVFGSSIIVSIIYIIWQNPFVGTLFVIGGLLMIIPQFIFNKKLNKTGLLLSQAKEESLKSITDFGKGINSIRSNQAESDFSNHTLNQIRNTEHRQFQYFTTHNLVMFWTGPLKGLGIILPFIIGLTITNLPLTTLIAMMTASTYLINPLQQLLEASSNLQSSQKIKEKILQNAQTYPDDKQLQIKEASHISSLEITHLSKSFPEKVIVKEANLKITEGEHVLLVGESGSGKSTLLNILSGEDQNYSGNIVYTNRKNYQLKPSYNFISLIHQIPYIFQASLRDNLTLYQNYNDEQLLSILKAVGLSQDFNQNLDYYLDGHNLSGGQIMRLEIARTLLRQKSVILADEITASLDRHTAKSIRTLLHQLPKTITIIEVAHKYNPEDYDTIYELKNAKIIKMKQG
ncbi:ATP-binding cassette domain-containing protein [Streptococcus orisratti]|uniref:ATP-binding cassette domain-containing protein n=1 Tax=Streptococcus orisratti TaxID=114652 RepID=UPI003D01916B